MRQLQKRPSQRPGKKCLLSTCATPVFLDSCAAMARGCAEQESKLCLLLAETVFWEYKRNVMKYSDLHLKENQELHSCFLCLRIGPGMRQQQTLSTDSQECPKMCSGLCLAPFATLIPQPQPPFLTFCCPDHIRNLQVKAPSP